MRSKLNKFKHGHPSSETSRKDSTEGPTWPLGGARVQALHNEVQAEQVSTCLGARALYRGARIRALCRGVPGIGLRILNQENSYYLIRKKAQGNVKIISRSITVVLLQLFAFICFTN